MENSSFAKKVLILAANPLDTVPLNLDREVAEIRNSLKLSANRDKFVIEARGAVRPAELQEYMYELKPQIVHFSGHGGEDFIAENKSPSPSRSRIIVDTNNPKPTGLVFEDNDGQSKLVPGIVISDLFKIFSDHVECVVLNACHSDQQAKEIVKHIPYVIAMSRAISDEAARNFSLGFYRAIWDGRSIEEAFLSGKNAIELDGIPEGLTPRLFKREDRQVPIKKPSTPKRSYWKWLPLPLIIIPAIGVTKLLLNPNSTTSQAPSGSEVKSFKPSPIIAQPPDKPEPSTPSLSPSILEASNNPPSQALPSTPKTTQIPAAQSEKIPQPVTKTANSSSIDKEQKSLPQPSQTFLPSGVSVTPKEQTTKATEAPNNQGQKTPVTPKKSEQSSSNPTPKPVEKFRKGSGQISSPLPQPSDTPATAPEVKVPKSSLKDAKVHVDRGVLLLKQKQYPEAQQEFDKAIKKNPNSAWAYNHRGISYCRQELYLEAEQDIRKSAELFKQKNNDNQAQKELQKLDNLIKNRKCGVDKSEHKSGSPGNSEEGF